MKIRKLVAASDVQLKANDQIIEESSCSMAVQEDYSGAVDCIQNAINFLSHAVQCDKGDVIARESIANLAVVLLDLKSAHSTEEAVTSDPVEEVIVEDET